jgi:hemerythrin-like domain-containing protein
MEALHIIGEEHQSLAAILHAIRFMLKEAAAGRLVPDRKLLQAMVHYLDAYAEQRHHPKEDLLFKYLVRRTSEGSEALTRLTEQHAAAPERIAQLQQAVDAYVAEPSRLEAFALAFERYADFYRSHMLLEEEVVLPLVRRHLQAEDWAAVNAEFKSGMAAGAVAEGRQEDFKALFSRLVECAPAPLGLGPRPWQD